MSFAKINLSSSTIDDLWETVHWAALKGSTFSELRVTVPMLHGDMNSHVFMGVHSFTVIGDYVFFYEGEALQHCLHIDDDSDQLFKAFQLMCHHNSASTEEIIDLYEGFTVTSRVPTGRALLGAGLDVATKLELKAGLALA